MISTSDNKSDQICLWCGKNTENAKSKEHIFPECVGGKRKLPIGYVCDKCPNGLSYLDRALLKEHSGVMDAYQVDFGIKRKGRKKKDKERYLEERKHIQGVGEASSTRVRRDGNNVEFLNANNVVTSENFVRSLHKCTANVLCDLYGSIYVRKNYAELLNFVKNGGDIHPWSYAISYPHPFDRILISEPIVIKRGIVKSVDSKKHEIIIFVHTSGIWIVGSSPFLLDVNFIKEIASPIKNHLEKKIRQKPEEFKKPITEYFGFAWDKKARTYIGDLKFLWVVKEIEGNPNDEFLYLLTRCKICGQTNPTGIVLPRDIIYNGNTSNVTGFIQNTWNHYILNDLVKLGFKIEKWNDKSLKEYMNQGISIPIENDVKKMNISNCKTECIGCNNLINFNANDCFV